MFTTYLQWRLHGSTANHNMFGGTGHSLIGGRTQDVRHQLMLKRICATLGVLTPHIASTVDLIETFVGQWSFAHKTLNLTCQLIVNGECHIFRCTGYEICHQRRCGLDSANVKFVISKSYTQFVVESDPGDQEWGLKGAHLLNHFIKHIETLITLSERSFLYTFYVILEFTQKY